MNISQYQTHQSQNVIELFTDVFTDSEGINEGQVIGRLVENLIASTDAHDLMGFVATDEHKIIGCIFFSKVITVNNANALMLSPVAINTEHQGKGVGQALINAGLSHLKSIGVERVFSYGDPQYYSKLGFEQINDTVINAPFSLTYPEGWIGKSLNDKPLTAKDSVISCVDALNHQEYW